MRSLNATTLVAPLMRKQVTNTRSVHPPIEILRDKIVCGELVAGCKVNEVQLAETLGVSRTPLREALRGLQAEGFIRAEHNRGFWVCELNAQEVRDLYPVVWTLENLAVADGWLLLRGSVSKLRSINVDFTKSAKNPSHAAASDDQFHHTLISCSTNRALGGMLASLKTKLRRYELVYMEDSNLISLSGEQHEEIISGIENGDLKTTQQALERNWRFGMEVLLSALTRTG